MDHYWKRGGFFCIPCASQSFIHVVGVFLHIYFILFYFYLIFIYFFFIGLSSTRAEDELLTDQ
jgi:uncharacterized Tic20 family protein